MSLKIIYLIVGSMLAHAEVTTKEIRSPEKTVFDITKNTDYALSVPEIYSEKIPTEISPIWGYRLRANKIDTCKTDVHSATYCPLEMAVCASQWDYTSSQVTTTSKTFKFSPSTCSGIQVAGICYTATAADVCGPGLTYDSSTKTCSKTVITWDGCEGGAPNWWNANSYCASKGMRLPTNAETSSQGGPVPSCGTHTWTSQYPGCGEGYDYGLWLSPNGWSCWGSQPKWSHGVRCVKGNQVSEASGCTGSQIAGVNVPGGVASKCYEVTNVCGQASYNPPSLTCPAGTLSGSNCINVPVKADATITSASGYAILFTHALDQWAWCFAASGSVIMNHNSGYSVNGVKACGCPVGQGVSETYRDWHTRHFSCSGSGYVCSNGSAPFLENGVYKCNTTTTVPATVVNSSCTADYKFYSYQCSSQENQFGKDYAVVNPGGVDCGGSPLVDTNGDGIGDSCTAINSASNCKREKFSCVANAARPCAEIAGQFKCSPFACDTDKKCGYAHCPTEFGITNGTELSPLSADPLKYVIQATTCTGSMCDLVQGPKYTMCGHKSCPAGFGVYEKAGKCYKDTCKSPSVEIDGKCVTKQ